MTEQPVIIDESYTGDVTPGGPAHRRTVPGATIVKLAVGAMNNNVYLVTDEATGRSVLIDAANEPDTLVSFLRDNAPGLDLIVTTHQHWDHWQGLEQVVAATRVPTAAHPLDAGPLPVTPDRLLNEGDTVQIGETSLEVIHLAGHTPGSVALVLTERGTGRHHIFTGDSLFPGGIGRTTNPEEFTSLLDDVETKLFGRFGDDTVIYPGHGKDTTLGLERPFLSEWQERGW
ncbi:MAG: MBL fold metallo-hydrolase [Rhodococcus sp.]|uniref:MBL fold metallo-hydrolase n=1 Tax=Rhodococcus TaxID=1827 RepID=UPI0016A1704C|nr:MULTISPECIES: MBL fold metallo-hydrolase [Rhodococcus]NLV80825.1 MBL fold metallo-hydrolase [Rhodococcus sp. (in: high G+C Gram-positive bacteria)]